MGPVHRRALSRSRRASLLKKDKEGVASTVGTVMALMVFITFMALITNSYVPAWMLDNERSHMNRVTDQFGTLKGNVDSMILQQRVTGDNSIKMYSPIKLGSEGVPLFATPTVGLLSYIPQGTSTAGVRLDFIDEATGQPAPTSDGGGRVDLYVPNRYYVPQWVCYENGAIIVKQDDGQSVKANPNLDIQKTQGGSVKVSFTQVNLIGTNQSLTGSDSVGLNLDLIYLDVQKYLWEDRDGTVQLTISTTYGMAWHQYLEDYLSSKNLVPAEDYELSPTTSPGVSTDSVATITLVLKNVYELNYNRAQMSMTMLTT